MWLLTFQPKVVPILHIPLNSYHKNPPWFMKQPRQCGQWSLYMMLGLLFSWLEKSLYFSKFFLAFASVVQSCIYRYLKNIYISGDKRFALIFIVHQNLNQILSPLASLEWQPYKWKCVLSLRQLEPSIKIIPGKPKVSLNQP